MKTRLDIIDTGSGPQPWCLVQVTDDGRHPVRANMLVRDECGDVRMLHGRACGETRDECVSEVLACLAAYIDLAAKPRVADTLRLTDAEREALAWAESAAANAQHPAESVLRSLRERHAP